MEEKWAGNVPVLSSQPNISQTKKKKRKKEKDPLKLTLSLSTLGVCHVVQEMAENY